jgi:hypothetical protein
MHLGNDDGTPFHIHNAVMSTDHISTAAWSAQWGIMRVPSSNIFGFYQPYRMPDTYSYTMKVYRTYEVPVHYSHNLDMYFVDCTFVIKGYNAWFL